MTPASIKINAIFFFNISAHKSGSSELFLVIQLMEKEELSARVLNR
jgi:hypothetical protein